MKSERKGLSEINLTSLVDVSLTLVIIFMVSSPFIVQSQIQVSTPSIKKEKTVPGSSSDVKVELYLREDGEVLLNGQIVPSDSLHASLTTLLAASRNKQVLISADGNVMHDDVVALMDAANQCGAVKLSVVKRK